MGRPATLEITTKTLDKMAAGGIYDHLGGGFHRYAVDERWLVPHFEKMLYDNALSATCYVEAFLATGKADYAQVARETLDYVLRDMTDAAGGFYSSEDADSEGEEGKFYMWSPEEVAAVLGPDAAAIFEAVYDVSAGGEFRGPQYPQSAQDDRAVCRPATPGRRPVAKPIWPAGGGNCWKCGNRRVRPGRDDKVLLAWNSLLIEALALAAGALDEPRYLAAAIKAAGFILTDMRREDGRLWHTWRAGHAKVRSVSGRLHRLHWRAGHAV